MNPFERVLHFGDRFSTYLLAGAVGASVLIHSGFALASYVRALEVTPAQPTCRAGETIQLDAFARTAWGSQMMVTNSAKWHVGDGNVASVAAPGFLRCVSEGTTEVKIDYLNRATSLSLKVEPPIVMVDVAKEEPPPPPPPPMPDPDPAPIAPAPVAKVEAAPPPPAAAKAGNLLTAPDDPTKSKDDEPYSFVTDPNGQEYGSGTVAKGGTADHAGPGAVASGVANGTPGGKGTTPGGQGLNPAPAAPVVDLSAKPELPSGFGCSKAFFPADADDDVAVVQVVVTVKPDGQVATVSVLSENPKGQGFGKAARSCLLGAKFAPGKDKSGQAVMATTTANVRFTR